MLRNADCVDSEFVLASSKRLSWLVQLIGTVLLLRLANSDSERVLVAEQMVALANRLTKLLFWSWLLNLT